MPAESDKRGPARPENKKKNAKQGTAASPAAVLLLSLLALVAGFCLPLAVKAL